MITSPLILFRRLIFSKSVKLKVRYFACPKFFMRTVRQYPHSFKIHGNLNTVNFLIITPVCNGTYFLKFTINFIIAIVRFISDNFTHVIEIEPKLACAAAIGNNGRCGVRIDRFPSDVLARKQRSRKHYCFAALKYVWVVKSAKCSVVGLQNLPMAFIFANRIYS